MNKEESLRAYFGMLFYLVGGFATVFNYLGLAAALIFRLPFSVYGSIALSIGCPAIIVVGWLLRRGQ